MGHGRLDGSIPDFLHGRMCEFGRWLTWSGADVVSWSQSGGEGASVAGLVVMCGEEE